MRSNVRRSGVNGLRAVYGLSRLIAACAACCETATRCSSAAIFLAYQSLALLALALQVVIAVRLDMSLAVPSLAVILALLIQLSYS